MATATKGKRQLAGMFLDLVDRNDWPQYYEIIPEPRCLNAIKSGVEKGRYKDVLDVYTDLSLVFWNAIYYNEPASQIANDAQTLKTLLETEWKKKGVFPPPRTSPPPSSAQKVHKVVEEEESSVASTSAAPTPAFVPTPAPAVPRVVAQARSTPIPTASTSTNPPHTKPVPILPRSQPSPEMDVDIMSEAGEAPAATHRDPESEEIVKQLEKGLPSWPGPGEEGWLEGVSQFSSQERLSEVLHAIKSYKDAIGNRPATALEAIPDDSTTIPHLSFTTRLRSKSYESSREFDREMARLFEKARRYHKPGTESYGRVLLLQRFYQALLSNDPPPGPPYHTTTNFAASRAGPGNVKPVHGGDSAPGVAGVTTHRVLSKDRTFVDELNFKGWNLKLGDWVHLSNPDDSCRPIVAQVFRCWISDEISKKGQPGITVSWYYRPEQDVLGRGGFQDQYVLIKPTVRNPLRIESAGHFADHPLEDIIEKIACQFTARHIRGRPRPPFWYPGFPLYVCDSRYNDRDRVFVKIKNWNSCVPEEVRKSTEFMPIYPFERNITPNQFPSPLLGRGVKGPGGLVAPAATETSTEQNATETAAEPLTTTTGGRTLRTRKPATDDHAGSAKGYAATTAQSISVAPSASSSHQQQTAQPSRPPGPDRSVLTAAGALAVGAHIEKLPAETAKHFDRDPVTNEVLWFPAPPIDIARPVRPKYSLAYLHFLARKRKRELSEPDVEGGGGGSKRICVDSDVPPTVTESLRSVLKEAAAGTAGM
ncbi:hypothetical protein H0H92_008079 [Tricholoma furcatifolium]|nr:hypothetical protein H0H92_008079 [Tricholoma furcatifolium]